MAIHSGSERKKCWVQSSSDFGDGVLPFINLSVAASVDPLLQALGKSPRSYKDVYRLLLFICTIPHHATLQPKPVASYESIWLPISSTAFVTV
jgi:hypothetical protein